MTGGDDSGDVLLLLFFLVMDCASSNNLMIYLLSLLMDDMHNRINFLLTIVARRIAQQWYQSLYYWFRIGITCI